MWSQYETGKTGCSGGTGTTKTDCYRMCKRLAEYVYKSCEKEPWPTTFPTPPSEYGKCSTFGDKYKDADAMAKDLMGAEVEDTVGTSCYNAASSLTAGLSVLATAVLAATQL
jgi:hypothetical protein